MANGRIYDFCDGEVCQSHPLFSRDPSALQIILYYDEVECVNPLGSKTKKHKIGIHFNIVQDQQRSAAHAVIVGNAIAIMVGLFLEKNRKYRNSLKNIVVYL